MHLHIVSGILLIVHIVNLALAAPVLVQDKRQPCADMAGISEYPRSVLGKRGETWGEIEEVGGKYIDNWFALPKGSSAAHGSLSSPPAPKPAPFTDTHVSSNPAPAPNPRPLTEAEHSSMGTNAPQSSTVNPTLLRPDNKLMGAQAMQLNKGPLNPSTESESNYKIVAEEPPSPTKGSSKQPGPVPLDWF